MKLLHTSDLHIGISLFGLDMLRYQERLGDIIAECAKENGCECIIIAGDVFDSAIVSAQAVACWDRLCTRLILGGVRTVAVIPGNHDSAQRLSVCSSLLERSGLYIRGSLDGFDRPICTEEADIYCIPYFNLSQAREYFPERDIKSVTDAFAAITEEIRSSWDTGKRHILAAHCFAAGASLAESERATAGAVISAGGAQLVSADVFAGFDYVALGHLHRAQDIKCRADTKARVRYSGTPMPYSFSEAAQEKSVTVYDTKSGVAKECPIPCDIRLITVEDSCERILSGGCAEGADENTYYRIRITDRASAAGVYNTIKEKYPGALRIECTYKPKETASTATANTISEMSVSELASKYLAENFGRELTEEMEGWLLEASK